MSVPMPTYALRRMIDTGDVQVCRGSSCPGAPHRMGGLTGPVIGV